MTDFSLILLLIGLAIGFFVGKYIFERIKWGDKKKLLEAQWQSKLNQLYGDYKMKMLETEKKWQVKYSTDLAEIRQLFQGAEKFMRDDAVKRSRRTLLGRLWEQVSPYIPKFPFKPYDMRFLGSPIDFIVFDGMGEKDIKKVIFLEVKSGESSLNAQEKKLKEVIESGKVSWKLFNVKKPEKMVIEDEVQEESIEEEKAPQKVYQIIDEKISQVKKHKSDNQDEDETDE